MKKAFFLFTCALAISTAHAKVITFNDTPRIISASDLSYEKIHDFIFSKNSDFTVELKEGTAFPVQFLAKNPFLSAIIDPNLTFKVEKTCYLRIVNKKCYMSEDLINWEKMSKALEGKPTFQLSESSDKLGFVFETHVSPSE